MLESMLDPSDLAPERIRPLSRREYDRMVDLGMFEDEHVELLRGMLVEMSPQGEHHGSVVAWFAQRLSIALGMSLQVRPALPLAADDYSEPEPDVAVCTRDHGVHEHPARAVLLIEVAYSSLRKDRGIKLQIYAQAGIAEYWVVDITTMTVEVYTQPTAHGYASVVRLRDGDVLRPTRLPGVELPVAEIPR